MPAPAFRPTLYQVDFLSNASQLLPFPRLRIFRMDCLNTSKAPSLALTLKQHSLTPQTRSGYSKVAAAAQPYDSSSQNVTRAAPAPCSLPAQPSQTYLSINC